MLGFVVPAYDFNVAAYSRQIPAIYKGVAVAEGGLLPSFGASGTGGFEGVQFVLTRQGYNAFKILDVENVNSEEAIAPYADLMKEVKVGFGRTMSHLPAVFGVSRQTIYNWLNGEIPKEQHQAKIVQLAAAARVFVDAGFKPTALSLERVVEKGSSLLELIAQGSDGKEVANRLVRIEKRGASAREKINSLLSDKADSRPDISDIGRVIFYEKT